MTSSRNDQDVDYKKLFKEMILPSFVLVFTGEKGEGVCVLKDINDSAKRYVYKGQDEDEGGEKEGLSLFEPALAGRIKEAAQAVLRGAEPQIIKAQGTLSGEMGVACFLASLVGDRAVHFMGMPAEPNSDGLLRERDDAISLLTSVFDVSEVGIVVTDRKRHIVRVNDSFVRIYGWSRGELIGKDFTMLTAPEERELASRNHEEFMRSGIRSSGEMKLLRKDGNIANALFTTAALELSNGRRFQVTTIMDITLRKQMEMSLRFAKEQADTANQAKSTFLANMSHELRTPLNAIIGFSEMMMKETFGPLGNERYKEYLGDIHLSARHLLEIINEVLDMSKIEAGRVELDEEYMDVHDLIVAVNRMMVSRAFSSGLRIEEKVEEDLPPLYADSRLIRQILINLVGNAVKYSKTNGAIEVIAQKAENGALRLIVKDYGVGIPKSRIREALEPFGQVSIPGDNYPNQGTGLGLPIAKAMAELHQGSLMLESDVGKGTTVTVELPAWRLSHKQRKHGEDSPLSKFKERGAHAGVVHPVK